MFESKFILQVFEYPLKPHVNSNLSQPQLVWIIEVKPVSVNEGFFNIGISIYVILT